MPILLVTSFESSTLSTGPSARATRIARISFVSQFSASRRAISHGPTIRPPTSSASEEPPKPPVSARGVRHCVSIHDAVIVQSGSEMPPSRATSKSRAQEREQPLPHQHQHQPREEPEDPFTAHGDEEQRGRGLSAKDVWDALNGKLQRYTDSLVEGDTQEIRLRTITEPIDGEAATMIHCSPTGFITFSNKAPTRLADEMGHQLAHKKIIERSIGSAVALINSYVQETRDLRKEIKELHRQGELREKTIQQLPRQVPEPPTTRARAREDANLRAPCPEISITL